MSDGNGGNLFSQCFVTNNGSSVPNTNSVNITFNAPTSAGVYYITQESTWWYYCGQFGDPIHSNVPASAIAVVVVNVSSGTTITASTTATETSNPGDYAIQIQGCAFYNPNYIVTLQNGTLTVLDVSLRVATSTPTPKAKATQTQQSQAQASPQVATTAVESKEAGKPVSDARVAIAEDRIYPNPAYSSIRLQLKEDVQVINDIKIYDRVGRLNNTSSKKIGEGSYDINVSGLSRGMYFIVVKTASEIKTFKFIKL
jgi:hypothetical protein